MAESHPSMHLERVSDATRQSTDVLAMPAISADTGTKSNVDQERLVTNAASRADEIILGDSPIAELVTLVSNFDASSVRANAIAFKKAIAKVPPDKITAEGLIELQSVLLKKIAAHDPTVNKEAFGCLDYLRLQQLVPPSVLFDCAGPTISSGISERAMAIAFTTSGADYLRFTEAVLAGEVRVSGNVAKVVRQLSVDTILNAHKTMSPEIIEKLHAQRRNE
jgi:hypothetical protein